MEGRGGGQGVRIEGFVAGTQTRPLFPFFVGVGSLRSPFNTNKGGRPFWIRVSCWVQRVEDLSV